MTSLVNTAISSVSPPFSSLESGSKYKLLRCESVVIGSIYEKTIANPSRAATLEPPTLNDSFASDAKDVAEYTQFAKTSLSPQERAEKTPLYGQDRRLYVSDRFKHFKKTHEYQILTQKFTTDQLDRTVGKVLNQYLVKKLTRFEELSETIEDYLQNDTQANTIESELHVMEDSIGYTDLQKEEIQECLSFLKANPGLMTKKGLNGSVTFYLNNKNLYANLRFDSFMKTAEYRDVVDTFGEDAVLSCIKNVKNDFSSNKLPLLKNLKETLSHYLLGKNNSPSTPVQGELEIEEPILGDNNEMARRFDAGDEVLMDEMGDLLNPLDNRTKMLLQLFPHYSPGKTEQVEAFSVEESANGLIVTFQNPKTFIPFLNRQVDTAVGAEVGRFLTTKWLPTNPEKLRFTISEAGEKSFELLYKTPQTKSDAYFIVNPVLSRADATKFPEGTLKGQLNKVLKMDKEVQQKFSIQAEKSLKGTIAEGRVELEKGAVQMTFTPKIHVPLLLSSNEKVMGVLQSEFISDLTGIQGLQALAPAPAIAKAWDKGDHRVDFQTDQLSFIVDDQKKLHVTFTGSVSLADKEKKRIGAPVPFTVSPEVSVDTLHKLLSESAWKAKK